MSVKSYPYESPAFGGPPRPQLNFQNAIENGEIYTDDGNNYTDPQTAINNATDWVYFGPGTFTVSSFVSLDTSISVIGSGKNSTTVKAANTDQSVFSVESDEIELRDMWIEGDGGTSGGSSNTTPIVINSPSANSVLSNLRIKNKGPGSDVFDDLQGYNMSSWFIENVDARNGFNTTFLSSRILGCRLGGMSIQDQTIMDGCIFIDGGNHRIADECTVSNCVLTYGKISSQGGGRSLIIGCHMEGFNAGNPGIELKDKLTVVVGNRIKNTSRGLDIEDGNDRFVITGNLFQDVGKINLRGTRTAFTGNVVRKCPSVNVLDPLVSVVGNTFDSSTSDAINVDGSGTASTIADNAIHNPSSKAINSFAEDCCIEGNIASAPGDDGIQVSGDNCSICNNVIRSSANVGIDCSANDSVIDGNVEVGSTNEGIIVSGTQDIITSNRTENDIDLSSSTNPTFDNNVTGALN